MNRATALLLLVFLAQLASGAGCGVCREVASRRQAFLAATRTRPDAARPQLRLLLPTPVIEGWLDSALTGLPRIDFDPPVLSEASWFARGYQLGVRQFRIRLDREQQARLALVLEVSRGGRSLFDLDLEAVAPLHYDPATRRLRISVRADLFEQVTPRLSATAVERLTDDLFGQIPQQARVLVQQKAIRQVAQKSLKKLTQELYRLVRARLLTPLGELTSFEVRLPDLPLTTVTLSSSSDGWVVEGWTELAGRPLADRPLAQLNPHRVRWLISAELAANLGNWAMEQGKLPSRYSRAGRAEPQGEFLAGVGWVPGARPLQAHFWTAPDVDGNEPTVCMYARAAGVPILTLQQGQLKVGFEQGRIEELVGPPGLSQALELLGVTSQVFKHQQQLAAATELRLGRGQVRMALTGVALQEDQLAFELELGRR